MAAFDDEDMEDLCWQELLACNPLFEELRYSEGMAEGTRNLMCEITGDLFVWFSSIKAMLTTSLKRIAAKSDKEQVFQVINAYPSLQNIKSHAFAKHIVVVHPLP